MTIIDWMFEHPWMTFFILIVLADSIGRRFSIVKIEKENKEEK